MNGCKCGRKLKPVVKKKMMEENGDLKFGQVAPRAKSAS